jgi:hypothetical protein
MLSMTTEQAQVLVFKTNINSDEEAGRLSNFLSTKAIRKWNVDLEDKDRILRIVTDILSPEDIIGFAKQNGLECEELE